MLVSRSPKSDVSVPVSAVVARTTLPPAVAAIEIKIDGKKDDVTDESLAIPDEQLLEEVIPDDLSEFSDEADEILNRQEVGIQLCL